MYSLVNDLLNLPPTYESYTVAVACVFAVCITLICLELIVKGVLRFFKIRKER